MDSAFFRSSHWQLKRAQFAGFERGCGPTTRLKIQLGLRLDFFCLLPATQGTGGTSLLQARTVNEVVKAQTNKVRLARLKGELVDRPQAIAHVFKLARSECDAWLNWPARVSAQMAAKLGVDKQHARRPHTYSRWQHANSASHVHGLIVMRREAVQREQPVLTAMHGCQIWMLTQRLARRGTVLHLPIVGRYWRQHANQAHRRTGYDDAEICRRVLAAPN